MELSKPSFALALLAALLWTDSAYAGRPLVVEDAGILSQNSFEVDTGPYFTKNHGEELTQETSSLFYGLPYNIESELQFGAQVLHTPHGTFGGIEDTELDLRWGAMQRPEFVSSTAPESGVAPFSLNLVGTVTFPTGDAHDDLGEGRLSSSAGFEATRTFNSPLGGWSIDANLEYEFAERGSDNWFYGMASRLEIRHGVIILSEIFANTPLQGGTAVQADAGFQYEFGENFAIDFVAGTGLNHLGPDLYLTSGFVWTF